MKNKQRIMNNEHRAYKAFTLIELVVAVAILAIVFTFAGVIFKVCINSYRTAVANAEIIQKLRAITDQLNADFKGLRKDGEIFVIWQASKLDSAAAQYDDYRDFNNDGYERFDRIMFFADGDFQSYGSDPKVIHGDVARICYMLAKTKDENGNWQKAEDYNDLSLTEKGRKCREEKRRGRILSRTQHILTADPDPGLPAFPFSGSVPDPCWLAWNNWREYEKMFLEEWKNMLLSDKRNALSVITDVKVNISADPTVGSDAWGAQVDPADPNTIHNLLCEGVGEFEVQGWYAAGQRWVPEVDPNGDGDLTDSDFFLGSGQVPYVLYPYPHPPYGFVSLSGGFYGIYFQELLNEAHFNEIPGLGRALKFTFTLYDSKGVIKEGREFTHIVYIGD
jgi:prepilin-type N-terminal cleavage/methylation domain-containing protein